MQVIKIETIDDEGRGRAFFEGHDYRVRGAFPGDEVEVEIERIFKAHNLWVCKTRKYISKGPYHRPRTCPHPDPCPACPLHGVDAALEQQVKRSRIIEALKKQELDFVVDSLVPHPNPFGYRQKVKLMVGGKPGNLKLGVYVPYSHVFIEASGCPHVNPAINQAIAALMPVLNGAGVEGLKAIILRAGQDGVSGIFVTSKALPEEVWAKLPLLSARERVQMGESNSLLRGVLGKCVGPQQIRSLEDGQWVDLDAFCQTDPVQARYLYEQVAEFLWQGPGQYVDAYAGVGGFSKALLKKGLCDITAIESNPACEESLRALGIEVWIATSAMPPRNDEILGMVLDPPKKGLLSEAKAYARLGAKRVALVSCDPNAMARDLRVLLEHGYRVQKIVPVDLFGATPAIETVVFLERCLKVIRASMKVV